MSRKRTNIKNPYLWKRISENYSSLLDFWKTSGVPLGWEAVRRAVYEGEKVSAPVIIKIMKYAGFSASEIKKYLRDHGEREFSVMVGECETPMVQLQKWEKDLLEIVNKIREKNPAAMGQINTMIETIAKAEGIEITKLGHRRK